MYVEYQASSILCRCRVVTYRVLPFWIDSLGNLFTIIQWSSFTIFDIPNNLVQAHEPSVDNNAEGDEEVCEGVKHDKGEDLGHSVHNNRQNNIFNSIQSRILRVVFG